MTYKIDRCLGFRSSFRCGPQLVHNSHSHSKCINARSNLNFKRRTSVEHQNVVSWRDYWAINVGDWIQVAYVLHKLATIAPRLEQQIFDINDKCTIMGKLN